MEAFDELTMSRQMGFGEGAIQLDQIEAYMRIEKIVDEEEQFVFRYLLHELDREYIEYTAEEREKKEKQK